jgi:hypothetical protein
VAHHHDRRPHHLSVTWFHGVNSLMNEATISGDC